MWWDQYLAAADPNDRAVSTIGGVLSYRDLAAAVRQAAEALPDRRTAGARRILVQNHDPLAVLVAVLAAWRQGCVPCVVRSDVPRTQVILLTEVLRPEAAVSDRQIELPTWVEPALIDPTEALVAMTSGTIGTPKAVALPRRSLLINTRSIGERLGLNRSDRVLAALPMGHLYGLVGCCLTALGVGAAIDLFPAGTTPTIIQSAIRTRGITVVQGPPAFFRLFLEYWGGDPFFGVRRATVGGELVEPRLRDLLRRAFPRAAIDLIYGMSEAGPRISHLDLDDSAAVAGSIGLPFDHWQVGTWSEDSAPGRLVLSGPALFLGYLQPGGGYTGLRPDGSFVTQDLVSLDPSGQMVFHGRADRVFKVGGQLVNATEVEQVLGEFPGVRDARCVPEEHPVLGQVLIALVLLESSGQVSIDDLRRRCAALLDPAAVPRRVEVVESLPPRKGEG